MTGIVSQVPRSFLLEVSRGSIPGYSLSGFLGINPTIGSSFETVWDAGGDFIHPITGETWEVVSDSVNDSSSGTGARLVVISGLDDAYAPASEIVTMNGTTPVSTTTTNWFRISSVIVIFSGSSKSNEGEITLRVSGAGAIRSKILTAASRTFNGLLTVPAGKTFFLLNTQIFIPKNEDVIVRNRVLVDGTNTWLSGGDVSVYQNDVRVDFSSIPRFPEKTDIEARVKSTNTAVTVSLNAEGILADSIINTLDMAGF